MTVSGVTRGEQRRRYDERRREVLREQGIALLELDYVSFKHTPRKRLQRVPDDEAVIRARLAALGIIAE